LDQLVGPVDGVVELPVDLAWSGDRRFDLADPVQRYLYHMTVLTSAVTREHYTRWLNASLLCGELNHPVVWMEFGPVIALADAVALKMGALHDRGLPRDVLDAHGAGESVGAGLVDRDRP